MALKWASVKSYNTIFNLFSLYIVHAVIMVATAVVVLDTLVGLVVLHDIPLPSQPPCQFLDISDVPLPPEQPLLPPPTAIHQVRCCGKLTCFFASIPVVVSVCNLSSFVGHQSVIYRVTR